jgi:uncharacterized protein (TIGR02594 family)
MKKLIFLLAACLLVSFSFITNSEARPKHKRYHYSKVYKHKKVKKPKITVAVNTIVVSMHDDSPAIYFANDLNRNNQENIVVKNTNNLIKNTYNGGNDLVRKASKYIGANARQLGLPSRLWCADFMNMLVGGNDRRAFSYIRRGSKANYGCTNCVAVTTRKGGGHVGVVKGYDTKGNPIMISGNHARRVGIGVYAKNRVIAYRYI